MILHEREQEWLNRNKHKYCLIWINKSFVIIVFIQFYKKLNYHQEDIYLNQVFLWRY